MIENSATTLGDWLREFGLAEIKFYVELFFEEFGAALGVAKVFGYVVTGIYFYGNGVFLKRRMEAMDALAVGVIQTFGDANDGGETPGDTLVVVVERGVGGMVVCGFRLAIVVPHHRSDHIAIAAFHAGNIAIEGQVLAMLVVSAMADPVANIMKQCTGFELHPGLRRQMVNG